MISPVVVTESLGGSPLAEAIQRRGLPAELQPWSPSTPHEWRTHIEAVRQQCPDDWFAAIEAALSPTGAAHARLDRVVSGGGVVVTTGQQAGLFGGPLYTLNKALTALALADALEHETGIPVAPVFWAATDDADFREASMAFVADADGIAELKIESPPPAGVPMASAPLGDTTSLLDRLRKASGSAAYAAYYDAAYAAYTAEQSIGGAYVRLLRQILEPLGIAVMDSSHPAYRAAARPVLVEALKGASDVAGALSGRSAAITELGFDPQVSGDRGLSLVFAIEGGVKRRLTIDEATAFVDAPAILAPNVLLRPVVERAVFPTVAYAAGPAELAYSAQVMAVADVLDRRPPVVVPRWSCTIVESFAERALHRLGVEYRELADVHALERRLAKEAMPRAVAAAWDQLQARVRKGLGDLAAAVSGEGLLSPTILEGLERSLTHRLNRAERRLRAAVKRRDEQRRRDIMVASAALFPFGKRQERVLNFVPMLARAGDALLDEMKQAAARHARALVQARQPESLGAR